MYSGCPMKDEPTEVMKVKEKFTRKAKLQLSTNDGQGRGGREGRRGGEKKNRACVAKEATSTVTIARVETV